jgi:large subunit ribosomal protein L15
MKLHDLKPADGSRTPRRRVGRGIAAGQGKTAGRGTKGQKARAGGSIPPWFEGGQTPLHMRIPKLRGFKNRLKIEYEIVNLGRIAELAQLGAFESGETAGGKKPAKAAPITVNQEILRALGLVRTLDKPMKVLGQGDIEVPLFVVADAFSKSAIAKIEAAGGSVQVLEVPTRAMPALGLEPAVEAAPRSAVKAAPAEPAGATAPDEATVEAPARAARPRTARTKTAGPTAEAGGAGDAPAGGDAAGATDEPEAVVSVEGTDEPRTDDAPAGEDA